MLTETIAIQVEGSLPGARLCIYIQEKSRELRIKERPLILLCPGGGYEWTSDREAEPMVVQFLAMGYHVAVLRYSCAPAVFPTALLELAEAMKLIHAHAAEWGVKEDQIYVEGCSAGLILCYPVITSGEYAHRGSFEALLKGQKTEEMLEKVSLEKQVTEHMPPVFLWHTFTDDCVPVENSLLLIAAMRKVNVPVEFHMYPAGGHGLSTCTEQSMNVDGYGVQEQCQSWLPLVRTWLAEKVRCKTDTNVLG